MRRRFFVDEVRNGHATIEGGEAHHLTHVLRVEAGQHYEISDNRDVYLADVETARKQAVVFRITGKLAPEPARARITLCASLIKFDRFEWMLEKATELGVARIVPVIAARSERGLDRSAMKRIGRWRRIALESSQQARRAHLPEIVEPLSFGQVLSQPAAHRYVLDEQPSGQTLAKALPGHLAPGDEVVILTGPEGGWTDAERAQFVAAAWTRVTMGPLIFRAETAAISALAVAANAWLLH